MSYRNMNRHTKVPRAGIHLGVHEGCKRGERDGSPTTYWCKCWAREKFAEICHDPCFSLPFCRNERTTSLATFCISLSLAGGRPPVVLEVLTPATGYWWYKLRCWRVYWASGSYPLYLLSLYTAQLPSLCVGNDRCSRRRHVFKFYQYTKDQYSYSMYKHGVQKETRTMTIF